MSITPTEGMLIKLLLDIAISEIFKKTESMTPEELEAAVLEAETETKRLMDEIDSH